MRLLESAAGRDRRGAGTVASVVTHAALVAAAVAGTVRDRAAAPARPPERVDVVYRHVATPRDRAGTRTNDASPRGPAPAREDAPSPPRVPSAPDLPEVRVNLAPIGLPGPGVHVELGASGPPGRPSPGASDGHGGAPHGTAGPGDDGTWSAHAVEVPVVADAGNPRPAYPEPLRAAGLGGRVVVDFVVDTTGRVRAGSLAVVEASHPLFAAAVRRTVPALRFRPATVQGRRVAQRVRVPFEFEVAGR